MTRTSSSAKNAFGPMIDTVRAKTFVD